MAMINGGFKPKTHEVNGVNGQGRLGVLLQNVCDTGALSPDFSEFLDHSGHLKP